MHIYMIKQYIDLQSEKKERFYHAACLYKEAGHQVTIFTSSAGVGLKLGLKKIGLIPGDGLTVVALNVPDFRKRAGVLKKAYAERRFAAKVGKQALQMPKPDLILAAAPPRNIFKPAITLSKHYSAPLVLEVCEPLDSGLKLDGGPFSRLAAKLARRLEEEAYGQAELIIAASPAIADLIATGFISRSKVITFSAKGGADDLEPYKRLLTVLKKFTAY